jgi:hypothetical protein
VLPLSSERGLYTVFVTKRADLTEKVKNLSGTKKPEFQKDQIRTLNLNFEPEKCTAKGQQDANGQIWFGIPRSEAWLNQQNRRISRSVKLESLVF